MKVSTKEEEQSFFQRDFEKKFFSEDTNTVFCKAFLDNAFHGSYQRGDRQDHNICCKPEPCMQRSLRNLMNLLIRDSRVSTSQTLLSRLHPLFREHSNSQLTSLIKAITCQVQQILNMVSDKQDPGMCDSRYDDYRL